jgi:hypothetical protein
MQFKVKFKCNRCKWRAIPKVQGAKHFNKCRNMSCYSAMLYKHIIFNSMQFRVDFTCIAACESQFKNIFSVNREINDEIHMQRANVRQTKSWLKIAVTLLDTVILQGNVVIIFPIPRCEIHWYFSCLWRNTHNCHHVGRPFTDKIALKWWLCQSDDWVSYINQSPNKYAFLWF